MAASPRSSLRGSALAALALIGVLSGCAPVDAPPGTSATASAPASSAVSSTTPPAPVPESGEPAVTRTPEAAAQQDETTDANQGPARAALEELTVKGRAPKTDYSREQFGARWSDVDHNGCDTRNDILRRDLTDVAVAPGTQGCKVLSGDFTSPFTGQFIDFVAGAHTSSDVQIDHVVALSDAWQKGAQNLDADRRTRFANDPLNLLAADGPSNSAKGDGDAATWLPPAKEFRCEYVARQITVKQRYELWVTAAEKRAMDGVLSQCPGQQLIIDPVVPEPVDAPGAPAPAETAPVELPAPGASAVPAPDAPEDPAPEAQGEAYFARCADARAAGAAPLHAGRPGYRPGLDGDGDGVACESHG